MSVSTSDLLSDLLVDLPLMGSRHYVVDDLGGRSKPTRTAWRRSSAIC